MAGKRVISTIVIETVGYRFRKSIFGKQILEVGELCEDYDTNTGMPDRASSYVRWRDANADDGFKANIILLKEAVKSC